MSKARKLLALMIAGIMTSGLLAACGSTATPSPAPAGNTATASATPSQNATTDTPTATAQPADTTSVQELNLRAAGFGTNFDVQDMGWRWMMAICYEGLLRDVADESGDEYLLAGAEKINVSDDGLTYTFDLRKNAKWSDGVAVTAKDYVYGWTRLVDSSKAYDYAPFIFNVVGAEEYYNGTGSKEDVAVKALEDYKLEVTLKLADPTFESKLVATPLYPTREDIAEAAGDNWGKDWKLCVYNGPFAMTELVEDNKMVWAKNEYYWNAENVKLEKVNWFAIPEAATAALMFENGQLDVFNASGDYITKYNDLAATGKVKSMTTQYPGTMGIGYELKNGGLSGLMTNVNIRKAISYAINREEMMDAVYGRYSAAYGLVTPAIMFNGKSYRSQYAEPMLSEYNEYAGDKAKLQALFQKGLDELGVTTPISDITVTFLSYGSATQNQTEREYIQQSLEQNIGCKVNLNTVGDYSMANAEREAFNFDIFITGWYADYNDPLDFFDVFRTGVYKTFGLFSDPSYDALLDQLAGLNDTSKRLDIYKQLEDKVLMEDCGFGPLYYADQHFYIQNWVKDFKTSSFGGSSEVTSAYIEGK